MKDFNLPKVRAGLSPKQVANQRWGVLKDIKELDHAKALKEKLLAKTPDFEVWLVKGKQVRAKHIEFVEGGHDYVYDWLPKNEIWIDDALHPSEYSAVMIHEIYERGLMKKGVPYSKAHKRANLVELRGRRKPSTQAKTLVRHGFKNYWCTKCKEYHSYNDKDKLYEKHIKYNHTN